ncbi:MAG: hypothetical protein HN341_00840 [Verrucomicrobia bacterium]|jgi:hypothetical protein|nr:hypothetical protein [Verrucomicrobiota bacterium]
MKHQYFGDINDYLKYGLLRVILRDTTLRLGVCWMLTADDGRPDGGKTRYLDQAAVWRAYDPPLFDILHTAVEAGERNISAVEAGRILPDTIYYSDLLNDNRAARAQYFEGVQSGMSGVDLVFFDPDNGMEVRSKPKGRRDSAKYLYWDEVKRFSAAGKSLIVFQHFARVKRDSFTSDLRERFAAECDVPWVGVLVTSNVAYFVVPSPAHERTLKEACRSACRSWHPHMKLA